MIRRLLLAILVSGAVFTTGCRHRCSLNDPANRPNPYRPPAPNSQILLPPAGVPTTPFPGPSGGGPPPGIVPGVGPGDLRNSSPIRPAPEVLLPDPIPGGSSSRSFSPENAGQGLLGGPIAAGTPNPPSVPKAQLEPPLAPKSTDATGLPGFLKVKDGIATGRKPALDGFESLKRSGYRSVIYLHGAGADVSAAKEVAEARSLRLVPLEVTPATLPESVLSFNSALADKANRPVYVFDDDGVRTASLWYLHFRTADAMNDDAARIRAKPLGFPPQGDEGKAFMLATQRYLETR